jgi:hypothetical protein
MAKKVVLALVLVGVLAGGVSAQTWYDSYAPGVDADKVFINGGIGFGYSAYAMGVPPISVSADFKLPISFPITVGGVAAVSTWRDSHFSGDYEVDVTYVNIGFGARGMYHFNFLKNLDTYAGLTLGFVAQTVDVKYGSAYGNISKPSYDPEPFFLFGVNLGARYFFTNNIGAYLELGYSGLQIVSLGVSVKI